MKMVFLISTLLLAGCAAKEAVVHQPLADCAISERDPSFFNSVVVVSCLPSTPGAQLFVSSGTSMVSAAMAAEQIVGGLTPKMAKAPGTEKGIFGPDVESQATIDEVIDRLSARLQGNIDSLSGYSLTISPITINLHKP
jgi:hypothetical protein